VAVERIRIEDEIHRNVGDSQSLLLINSIIFYLGLTRALRRQGRLVGHPFLQWYGCGGRSWDRPSPELTEISLRFYMLAIPLSPPAPVSRGLSARSRSWGTSVRGGGVNRCADPRWVSGIRRTHFAWGIESLCMHLPRHGDSIIVCQAHAPSDHRPAPVPARSPSPGDHGLSGRPVSARAAMCCSAAQVAAAAACAAASS
jgi:hypothetical protein